MMTLDEMAADARALYFARRFSEAFSLLDQIVAVGGTAPEVLGAHLLRALGYEKGNSPSGVDKRKALENYLAMLAFQDVTAEAKREALIGAARVMATMDPATDVERIEGYCRQADEIAPSAAAANLMGFVHHECRGDVVHGRRWFLRAFLRGSPWGMKFWAASHWRQRHVVRGALGHLLAATMMLLAKLVRKDCLPYQI